MKTFLTLLVFAGACQAQTNQVSVGFPTTYLRYNDNTNGNFVFADTMHCGSYTAAGNRYCLANDSGFNYNYPIGIDHVALYKLAPYSNSVANDLGITRWTDSSFQTAYSSDVGTTTCKQDGGVNNAHCVPYSYGSWTVAGHTYLHIFLVSFGLPSTVFDTVLLRSDDVDSAPPHFCNSATLAANGNTCPSNNVTKAGDAPNWSAGVSGGVTFPYSSTGTPNPMAHLMMVLPANYQDDGVNCPVIPVSAGGDGTGQYVYWFAESADYRNLTGPYRVSCANLPKLLASDWEAWNGSSWTSSLSSAAVAAKASMGYGTWGTPGAVGTSMNLTYLPDLGTFVMMGQYCTIYCVNSYQPTLVMSQASSLTGSWTPDIASRHAPPIYQNGTNPRTRKISGAMTAATAGTSQQVTMTVPYDLGMEPANFPFNITIGSEDLTVTAATGTSWTVTRGANGTTAGAHPDQSEVKAPYRLQWGTGSFVQGTYSFNNGVVTIDHISQGGQSDSTPNDQSKQHGVYGPYIQTLTFQRATPATGSHLMGNVPLRFSMGPIGSTALPRRGLQMFWDFFQHNGAATYGNCCNGSNTPVGLVYPQDLITGMGCVSAHDAGYAGAAGWNQYGYHFFSNDSGFNRRCVSTGNVPLSGTTAYTVLLIARPTTVGTTYDSPFFFGGKGSDTGLGIIMLAANHPVSGGLWMYTGSSGNGIYTPTTVWASNTWAVQALTKSAGTDLMTLATIYHDGAAVCGKNKPGTACLSAGGSTNQSLATGPVTFGLNTGWTGFTNWWNGDIAGFGVWDRELSPVEIRQVCRALKAEYARAPRKITLTCN